MTKKVFCILCIFIILVNCSTLSAGGLKSEKIEGIIGRQLEIDNFRVNTELEIRAFAGQSSRFEFTYYYQKPDRIHLDSEDFVLLPKEAVKTLQPNFINIEQYDYSYLKAEGKCQLFHFEPVDKEEKYRLILWLVPAESMLEHAEIFFRMDKYTDEFAVQIDFEVVDTYSLPVYVEGQLAVPTKYGMGGEIKESTEGSFFLTLNNYEINKGFPPEIQKKFNK